MQPIRRLLFLLKNNETAQSIAIALSVAGFLIGLAVLFLGWPVDEFRAAASTNYSTIDYDKVNCVSIGPHDLRVGGKDIPDPKLAKSIVDVLSIKSILSSATYSQCPWTLYVNVVPGMTFDVSDGLLPAQYLVSVGICQRTDDGHVNPNKCLNKDVYVFNWRVEPHDLFRIGLFGLKPETKEEEEFKVKAHDD
jgi:hypothetical protein